MINDLTQLRAQWSILVALIVIGQVFRLHNKTEATSLTHFLSMPSQAMELFYIMSKSVAGGTEKI
jgi:hypothetical protein